VALEELQDLKGVWSELSKIWEKIEDLREKPWLSVAPRKVRQELDGLLQQLKAFPARLKTYASYEYVQNLLKSYTKVGVFGLGDINVQDFLLVLKYCPEI
jgi:dynein heavy chain 1